MRLGAGGTKLSQRLLGSAAPRCVSSIPPTSFLAFRLSGFRALSRAQVLLLAFVDTSLALGPREQRDSSHPPSISLGNRAPPAPPIQCWPGGGLGPSNIVARAQRDLPKNIERPAEPWSARNPGFAPIQHSPPNARPTPQRTRAAQTSTLNIVLGERGRRRPCLQLPPGEQLESEGPLGFYLSWGWEL